MQETMSRASREGLLEIDQEGLALKIGSGSGRESGGPRLEFTQIKGLFDCDGSVRLAHTNDRFLPFRNGAIKMTVWHKRQQPFRFKGVATTWLLCKYISSKSLLFDSNPFSCSIIYLIIILLEYYETLSTSAHCWNYFSINPIACTSTRGYVFAYTSL